MVQYDGQGSLNYSLTLFQAVVSLKRLGKYLCSEELKVDNVSKTPLGSGKSPTQVYTE